jgi:DNA-binding XRE family transcriptional regulator
MATRSKRSRPRREVLARLDSLSRKIDDLLAEARHVAGEMAHLARAVTGDDVQPPPLPEPDAEGNRPALETIDALIARDIIERRKRAGLTQAKLAQRAGVRTETINRLEAGKHAPNVRTVKKIDAALKAAGA